ncbi:MAG TPA: glycine cleavage system protein T, partial [Acidimicrobiaceae bacterium]|nr:glycine cleavage system protein T [Acidimicrobiaceae bacterium]
GDGAAGGFDLRPVGAAVYGTSGRIEKGYRLMGAELDGEYSPVEAGLARPKVKADDFVGKQAYLAARAAGPAARLCVLAADSLACAEGYDRFPAGAGNEPILTAAGERIVDSHGRVSRVTTAGNAPSVGRYLMMGYLPTELCEVGSQFSVMYQNELYPATLAATGANLALFDPDDSRMKG